MSRPRHASSESFGLNGRHGARRYETIEHAAESKSEPARAGCRHWLDLELVYFGSDSLYRNLQYNSNDLKMQYRTKISS